MADSKQLEAKEVNLRCLQLPRRSIRYLEVNSHNILKETELDSTGNVSHCLFLGTDVMKNCGVAHKNLPRFHSQLAGQGCATKVTFPLDWRIAGMRLNSTSKCSWCYNIRGLLRVALEYYELVDQVKLLRDMQDEFGKFVQTFTSSQFPGELKVNSIQGSSGNGILPESLRIGNQINYSERGSPPAANEGLGHPGVITTDGESKLTLASISDHDYLRIDNDFTPLETLLAKKINVDATTQTFAEECIGTSPTETPANSIECERNEENVALEPESSKYDISNRNETRDEVNHSALDDYLAILAFLDAAKLKLTEMTYLSDIFPQSIGQLGIDCLELVRQEALIFKHTGHNIFPLNLIQDYLESKKSPEVLEIAHDYELVLHILSRWIGQQFASLNSFIRRKVDSFKQDHILDLQNMPPADEILAQVFPSGMTLLLKEWLKHVEQVLPEAQGELTTTTDAITLVCLELLNNTLITGKGHILFSRLQSQGTRSAAE